MARLIAAGGHSTEFHSGKVTLGEGPGVDVTLPAGLGIAKVHAEFRPLLGGYVIKQLGGDAFQTLVNDKSVATIANLTSGDNIRIGGHPLTLVLEDEPAAKEPAPTVEVSRCQSDAD
ncbi:FHA domain-containing protein [Verrucomicrobiales bacterium]|nr:FHA domain-containing protein [Verrucomicrobiales bacterium]MDC0312920.1 FHA domain-containing protein [Verrucomicrobiales bacterium]